MTTSSPHVILISSNLFGTSRISGVVRGNELTISVIRDADQLEKTSVDQLVAVLVDLDESVDLVAAANQLGEGVEKIAFGPHVDTAKLEAAARAGWNVLTRGQFDAELTNLAKNWASARNS